jgi:type II secretory pathway pseudopilin PulG
MKRSPRIQGFTMVELLFTIGIIVLLISILLPTVSAVRTRAYSAQTQAMLANIANGITVYAQNNGGAFPGPISNDNIYTNSKPGPLIYNTAGAAIILNNNKIASSENLVLGLLGGLYVNTTVSPAVISFDSSRVGQGPSGLNVNNPSVNRRSDPYIQVTSAELSTGQYKDDSGSADDSPIPEFLDKYPSAMPILYLRAIAGASSAGITATDNPVVTWDASDAKARTGQYDLHQIYGYTSTSIGVGKKLPNYYLAGARVALPSPPKHGLQTVTLTASLNTASTTGYQYPYDAYPYFTDPNMPNTARMKDQYILISAGPDRIYGTKDDIVNFGDINP